ncbi:MAG: prolyl oligopeptidase family serine peptidase [Planctomycetes bacterium]|nr:prolyl oligopeptidase family serine peptidase [Planctomycetota bacterium]
MTLCHGVPVFLTIPRLITNSLVVASCSLWLSSAAFAQGSAEDYERAARMPNEVRGKVVGEAWIGEWVSESELIYREDKDLGEWKFVSVDLNTGEKRAAFDHQALERQFRELFRRRRRSPRLESLSLRRFVRDGNALEFTLEGSSERYRYEDGKLTSREAAADPADRLEATRWRRSRSGGDELELTFVNASKQPVEVFWLDENGGRRSYGKIAAGERRAQHTFAGHVWLVLEEGGRELGGYMASSQGSTTVWIDGEVHAGQGRGRGNRGGAGRGGFPARRSGGGRSPDGTWRIEVRNENVYLHGADGEEPTPLTTDGSPENPYTNRIEWAPDSRHVMVMRVAPEQEHTVHLVESSPRDQLQPELHSFQYLKPGDRIAHPRPYVFDVEAKRVVPVDDASFSNPWSITRGEWTPDGKEYTFLYNQRGHQVLRWLALDSATGNVRTIIDEVSPTFVDYNHKTFLRADFERGEAIWMSERSGWNHLYMIDVASGTVKHPITQGEWLVRSIERVDAEARQIWFKALGVYPEQDPYHEHFGRVGFDGKGLTWLTDGDGTHALEYAPNGETYVDTYSRVDMPPVRTLRRTRDGALLCELTRADDAPLRKTGWQRPERFVAKGRDGETDIWGILIRPSNFDPAKRYPVIESIYAGPQGAFVPKRWQGWLGSRELAELGFIVVHIDGMGTNWRSKRFHDVCWKNLGDAGFPDRIAWMRKAAETRPWMDLERVGIYGGSAGGQNSLGGMLQHGDFYKACVSDCGCHDNRMDKIWWNELWMGWPIGPHYDEQSNVTMAHRLQGKLLLVVGELDRNVDPASTMQVVDALVRANKDFELLVVPGAGHGATGSPYGRRRRQDFFVRNLLGKEPRWKPATNHEEEGTDRKDEEPSPLARSMAHSVDQAAGKLYRAVEWQVGSVRVAPSSGVSSWAFPTFLPSATPNDP